MTKNLQHFYKYFSVAILAFFSTLSFADSGTYVFAVVPQFKPAQLQKEWSPIIDRISRETGIKLKLSIAPSIAKFESEVYAGTPDFAFMNPYQVVVAKRDKGYIPLLRDKKPLNGILVVRKDSPYKKVQDLNDKVIGFPAPNAFGASLYMRALLTKDYSLKFTPRYLNNHNLVFKHVAQGHVAAGGTVNAALNDEPQEMRDQLTVLLRTPDVASHPIAAHPRVPEQVKKSVTNALLNMLNDTEGRALLEGIRMPNLVDANFQKDYAPLEQLNIEKYLVQEEN